MGPEAPLTPVADFGKIVRHRMVDLSISQATLARRTGLAPNTISAALNGRSPTWRIASRILTALDLTLVPAGE